MIPTVNFHLTKACNYECKFCFATLNDIEKRGLSPQQQKEVISLLAREGIFRKINFAGGEPTLLPHIKHLIQHAKEQGFETSLVTNGSRIDAQWVADIAPYLDILALSIDSICEETNQKIGRHEKGKKVALQNLIQIAKACHQYKVHLKANTVVCKYNYQETLTDFINTLRPFRWKVFQVTFVEGQNDKYFEEVKISAEEFSLFCERNQKDLNEDIYFVPETEDLIRASYLMVDPLGRFYDDSQARHSYSPSILEVGVKKALEKIQIDISKFNQRKGDYSVGAKVLLPGQPGESYANGV